MIRRALMGVAVAIGLACTIAPIAAQEAPLTVVSEGPAVVPMAEQFIVRSKAGAEYLIQVSAQRQPSPGQKLAAVYLLDGNGAFGLATDTVRILSGSAAGLMQPAYVVAIGYLNPGESRRMTDYAHLKGAIRGSNLGGGGAAFEAFIIDELRPFIEQRFAVDPERSVLVGHSIGGLFVATLMVNRPEAFAAYLIASPSVQFDPDLVERARKVAPAGAGRRVFVSVGEKEGRVAVPVTAQFAGALTWPDSHFVSTLRILPDENHMSVTLAILRAGLPYLLPLANK